MNSEQNVEECDLAPPKLRKGDAQEKLNSIPKAGIINPENISTKNHLKCKKTCGFFKKCLVNYNSPKFSFGSHQPTPGKLKRLLHF
jgi:hypothetical protein